MNRIFRSLPVKWIYRIDSKLILSTGLLLAALSFFIYLFFPAMYENQARKAMTYRTNSIAEITAFSISPGLLFNDKENVDTVLEGIKQNEDLVYIVVHDTEGNTFTAYNHIRAEEEDYSRIDSSIISLSADLYKIRTQILSGDEYIGYLYLGFSLDRIISTSKNIRTAVAKTSLLLFTFGLIIVSVIANILTRPIKQMISTVGQISQGDLSQRTAVVSKDEVGFLAKSFNQMVGNLESTYRELKDLNITLEDRVKERTIELEKEIVKHKKAEKALHESEDKYRTLIETSPEAVTVTNLEGNLTFVSQRTLEIHGYEDKKELLGKSAFELIAPEDHEKAATNLKKTIEKGFIRDQEYTLLRKDRSRFKGELSASSINDTSGKPTAFIATTKDITDRKKAEEVLRESEEKYRSLFEYSPTGIVLHQHGKVIHVNTTVLGILGYDTTDEVIGKPVIDFVHPNSRELVKKRVEQLINSPGLVEPLVEETFLRKDGNPVEVATVAQSIHYKSEIAIQVSFIDNSERKRVEESAKKRYQRIEGLNKASQVLVSTLNFQEVANSCTGLAKELIVTDSATLFLLDDKKTLLKPIVTHGPHSEEILSVTLKLGEGITGQIARSGQPEIVNRVDLTGRGKYVPGTPVEPESLLCVPLKIKEDVIGVVTLSRQGEREFEKEDLVFMENLADISAVAIHNARLYEGMKQSEKLKTLFLANMSHEIRTPLNSIVGYSDLIELSVIDKVGPEERQFFEIIRSSNERLLKTIHGVLDISQIEAMSFELKPEQFNLIEITERVISGFHSQATEKNLELNFSFKADNSFIEVDKYCAQQAVSNLIDNAIKYTEEGYILVKINEQNGKLILTIEDTGIGIAEDYQGKLFEAFSQESMGYTKRYQGVGLGLSLTKRYLDLNEIPIELESKKGVGTKFTITFTSIKKPKKEIEKKELPVQEPPATERKINVLVVEDDQNAQNLFKFFLRNQYDTYYAVSVLEAKKQLKEQNMDLVLLDLSLIGNEDGLDLARFIRQSKQWKTLPIVAVTAHAFTSDRDNVLNAGCNDYMAKPIKKYQLLEKIQQHLN